MGIYTPTGLAGTMPRRKLASTDGGVQYNTNGMGVNTNPAPPQAPQPSGLAQFIQPGKTLADLQNFTPSADVMNGARANFNQATYGSPTASNGLALNATDPPPAASAPAAPTGLAGLYDEAQKNSPYVQGTAAWNARQNLAEQNVNHAYAGADQRAMGQGAMSGRVNSSGLALTNAEHANAMSSTLNGMVATAPTDQVGYLSGLAGLRTADQTYNQANVMNPLYADQTRTSIAGARQGQDFAAQLQPGAVQAQTNANAGTVQQQNFAAQEEPTRMRTAIANASHAEIANEVDQLDADAKRRLVETVVSEGLAQGQLTSLQVDAARQLAAKNAGEWPDWLKNAVRGVLVGGGAALGAVGGGLAGLVAGGVGAVPGAISGGLVGASAGAGAAQFVK